MIDVCPDIDNSKATRNLLQRRGTIHNLKMKQDSLKNKGSVSFAPQKKASSISIPSRYIEAYSNDGYVDSDLGEDMSDFSSHRGSMIHERGSVQFEIVEEAQSSF